MPVNCDLNHFLQAMSVFGHVQSVSIKPGSSEGLVSFNDREAAKKLVLACLASRFGGQSVEVQGCVVTVDFPTDLWIFVKDSAEVVALSARAQVERILKEAQVMQQQPPQNIEEVAPNAKKRRRE
jgi:hypothetical protein